MSGRTKGLVQRIIRNYEAGKGVHLSADELQTLMSGWIGTGLYELLEDSLAPAPVPQSDEP